MSRELDHRLSDAKHVIVGELVSNRFLGRAHNGANDENSFGDKNQLQIVLFMISTFRAMHCDKSNASMHVPKKTMHAPKATMTTTTMMTMLIDG